MINIEVIDTVDPGGLTIVMEAIDDQCRGNQHWGNWHLILGVIDDCHREDQQSTFTWKIQKI